MAKNPSECLCACTYNLMDNFGWYGLLPLQAAAAPWSALQFTTHQHIHSHSGYYTSGQLKLTANFQAIALIQPVMHAVQVLGPVSYCNKAAMFHSRIHQT